MHVCNSRKRSKPATKAPVRAEDMISKNGLSVLKIKSETR